jgi:UDP-3-O-[3-hydroxymyristoyl] glucosamine N-acyltransferase
MSWKRSMTCKIIYGCEPWLSMARDDWALVEPLTELIPITQEIDKNFRFDFSKLLELKSAEMTAFVAWGSDFLNFQRLELFGELKKIGLQMPPLIHPSSQVSPSAKIQENVWIQANSYIGPHTRIEFNSWVLRGSQIGSSCLIGRNGWIGHRCNIGSCVEIGSNVLLGDSIKVDDYVKIGKQVRVDKPIHLTKDIASQSFILRSSNLEGRIIDYSNIKQN